MDSIEYSLVIPVYKNEQSVPDLLSNLEQVRASLTGKLEVVFVVDGSPDNSYLVLKESLPRVKFDAQLILLSRNFGSYTAIKAGLTASKGKYMAVVAADLQEPPSMVLDLFNTLKKETSDIVLAMREVRHDPIVSKIASILFWKFYHRFVQADMPKGGFSTFGCNRRVCNELVALPESNTTLHGLLMWMGFKREKITYKRLERIHGKSSWSLKKKVRYALDSIFAFSDLPIRLLTILGVLGLVVAIVLSIDTIIAQLLGKIPVAGYSMTVITVMFFGGLNSLGLGLIGEYLWRTFENTKRRPNFIVQSSSEFRK